MGRGHPVRERVEGKGLPAHRQPIVAVLGHVDSGKTTLLDYIRKSRVAAKEPGSITQHIGASEIPSDVLKSICAPVFKSLGMKFELRTEGLLFIDLPGHEVFANLRRRGGSVADIAILVVDIFGGVQPQTVESINILKERKTPFIVSLNKIDALSGWKSSPGAPFIETVNNQTPYVESELERKLYGTGDQLAALGFRADRFDRVEDFTEYLAMVPTSALTGEGVPDLLAILIGVVQRYMLDRLKLTTELGKGAVLEVREETGLGTVITAIVYDGWIRKNDQIVLGGTNGPIVTSIRTLLRPRPLEEIRAAPRSRFESIEEARAASGIMLASPQLEEAVPGSPISVVRDPSELDAAVSGIREELESIMIRTEGTGIVVKADTLGSLEALVKQIEGMNVPIRKTEIGNITKEDVFEASVVRRKEEAYGLILGFNVRVLPEVKREAERSMVGVILDEVIYRLLEKLDEHLSLMKDKERQRLLSSVVIPCEIQVLPGYVFRRSKPAVVGIRVVGGRLRESTYLINAAGRRIGLVLEMQDEGIRKPEAVEGDEVAISIRGGVVGRNLEEGDTLYTDVRPIYEKKTRDLLMSLLSSKERELYERIVALKPESSDRQPLK